MFFSTLSIGIISLGEERVNLSTHTFVRFALVWFCLFFLPLGVWERLRLVIVELLGLFSYLFDTKLKVYRSVVLPTLLYACETWTVYQQHAKDWTTSIQAVLENFYILNGKTGLQTQKSWKGQGCSVHTLLKLAQLRQTGHVIRMPDGRLPKILYNELQVGKRFYGGQKKRYKDILKVSLKDFYIPAESWEQIVHDRTKWRCLIRRGAGEYKAKRISKTE